MGVEIALPIKVQVYNMGDLYMAQNGCVKRTRHIDSRHHFLYDYVENGIIMMEFVPTEDNVEDPFTKNNGGVIYTRHTGKFMYFYGLCEVSNFMYHYDVQEVSEI